MAPQDQLDEQQAVKEEEWRRLGAQVTASQQEDSEEDDSEEADAPGCGADEEWEEWEEEGDAGEEGEEEPAQSLFDDTLLPSPLAAIEHDARKHGFDLRQFIKQVRWQGGAVACVCAHRHSASHRALPRHAPRVQAGLSDYGVIQVINYIRAEVAAQRDPLPALQQAAVSPATTALRPWDDERFLIPTRPDDALLFYSFDEWTGGGDADAAAPPGTAAPAGPSAAASAPQPAGGHPGGADEAPAAAAAARLAKENAALRAEVQELRQALVLLRETMLQAVGLTGDEDGPGAPGPSLQQQQQQQQQQRADAGAVGASSAGAAVAAAAAGGEGPVARRPGRGAGALVAGRGAARAVDESYFEGYSGFSIHREMISDKVRAPLLCHGMQRPRVPARQVKDEESTEAPHQPSPWKNSHHLLFHLFPGARSRAPRHTARRWSSTPHWCGARPSWTWAAARASSRSSPAAAARAPSWPSTARSASPGSRARCAAPRPRTATALGRCGTDACALLTCGCFLCSTSCSVRCFCVCVAGQIASLAGYGAEAGGPLHVVASKVEELTELPGGITQVRRRRDHAPRLRRPRTYPMASLLPGLPALLRWAFASGALLDVAVVARAVALATAHVIVSEWMGYALLFETMLDSVLPALLPTGGRDCERVDGLRAAV